jgi:hypothetical protein
MLTRSLLQKVVSSYEVVKRRAFLVSLVNRKRPRPCLFVLRPAEVAPLNLGQCQSSYHACRLIFFPLELQTRLTAEFQGLLELGISN